MASVGMPIRSTLAQRLKAAKYSCLTICKIQNSFYVVLPHDLLQCQRYQIFAFIIAQWILSFMFCCDISYSRSLVVYLSHCHGPDVRQGHV